MAVVNRFDNTLIKITHADLANLCCLEGGFTVCI
jgi:hypothetical protein